ncbi:hypothetical protein Aaci_0488 [Alicyclobacillus acidocaldarius subsp. acidocaldarius DSM 446]|uniref:Uncharacterized protein n=1 Tax=Alicyclobacillus acidocaldarius subsp. acidocaldarius (strain ATCC 27009 / DSM 446 / BCRC 14685 / JCM 5260 / KCTC 1825 / NBRC 15652 / NCIMB 11725 / NRRL B-14509 / 104-IA) TaxID=521098 RepID=C8WSP0_ALIAD|nr:hypothetical protein Aaci_0488 [Alicyclobacillus acidocaldarius subsp. acidocaldarius DSM 446]
MSRYEVLVSWSGSRVYTVEAVNESEAEEIALEMAQSELWSDDWDEICAEVERELQDDDQDAMGSDEI